MIFQNVKSVTIPEGIVTKIEQNGAVLWKKARLPDAYQEVEYIQSTGTQYIDLGLVIDNTMKLETEVAFLTNDNQHFGVFYLAGTRPNIYYRKHFGVNGGKLTAWKPHWTGDSGDVSVNYDSNYHKYTLAPTYAKLDNQTTSTTQSSYPNYTWTAFARIYDGTISSFCTAKCKGILITKASSGDTIMDLVPCYRISDDEIGLYDLANNQFYSNNGTGTFLKGNDV